MSNAKQFKVLPLDMINAPNYWSPSADGVFALGDVNAQTVWFQLRISDALGERRYMPAIGSGLQIIFQRADNFSVGQLNPNVVSQQTLTITKQGVAQSQDASLFSIALTAADAGQIRSGTLKVILTEGGVQNTWVQNWAVVRKMTAPGC